MLKNGIDPSEKSLENSQIGADESDNKAIQTLKDIIARHSTPGNGVGAVEAGSGNALNVATA